MRRFVFEDVAHEVKVTIDMPENIHARLHELGDDRKEAIKKLVGYTIDSIKEEEDGT